MPKTSIFSYLKLAYLSGPANERSLYRIIAKRQPKRIVEIGLGDASRSLRMFEAARRYCESAEIHYTGIDPFESRSGEGQTLKMKDAYRLFKQQGVQLKLVPGNALSAMTVVANGLANCDLIVIDAQISNQQMQQAWRYFPRMMHGDTLVLRQTEADNGAQFTELSLQEIENLAQQAEQFAKAA